MMNLNKLLIKRFLFKEIEEVNVFIVACSTTRNALLIDAGGFDDRVKQFVTENSLKLNGLFITHHHYDHTGGVKEVMKRYPHLQIIAGEKQSVGRSHIPVEGEELKLGDLTGIIHRIPGHTDDMLSLYIEGHLFTGDALFAGSVGGTTSTERYFQQLDGIINRLIRYPDETVIHPGHGPDSTIGLEKMFNPFISVYN